MLLRGEFRYMHTHTEEHHVTHRDSQGRSHGPQRQRLEWCSTSQEPQGPLATPKVENVLPWFFKRASSCWRVAFRCLTSRSWRIHFCCVRSPSLCRGHGTAAPGNHYSNSQHLHLCKVWLIMLMIELLQRANQEDLMNRYVLHSLQSVWGMLDAQIMGYSAWYYQKFTAGASKFQIAIILGLSHSLSQRDQPFLEHIHRTISNDTADCNYVLLVQHYKHLIRSFP